MSYLLALDAGTGSIRAVIFDLNGRQLAVGQAEWKHLSVDNVPGSMEFDLTTNWQLACQCIRQALDAARLSAADIQSVACCSMREGIVLYDRNGEAIWACANVDARASRDWRPALLDMAGLRADMLSPVKETGTLLGAVTEAAAQQSGLRAGTPVVMGGGDVQLGCLGLGVVRAGQTAVLGGTFWQQVVNLPQVRTDPQMNIRVNPHVIPGMAQAESISFFTGLTMRWFRDAFCAEEKLIAERLGVDAYSLLEEMASRVPAGSHGVMPIFSDAMHFKQWYHAAPSFINLSIDPEKCNKATLFRALEENAAIVSACNLAQISQFSGVTFDSLVFAGGGSKGALWSQILSDVTGLPVRVPVVREATALGCAIAAGTGAGLYDDMASTGERLVSWHREFTPNPQHRELYQEMMSKWQTVYADQLGLVDSGLTTSMWQAPGLERRQRVASSPSP
ncbi:autoinducer-2 kinase [Klebsiella pneumoniae]|nr:autoinducer-2 kinase [Klebsiella pneumoniae]